MKASKMHELEQAQSGVARKILDHVPREEWWPLDQIKRALYDKQLRYDDSTVRGCLRSLEETGLIRSRRNHGSAQELYQREKPRDVVRAIADPQPPPTVPITPPRPSPPRPFDALTELANELRRMADSVDELALSLEQYAGDTAAKLEKLSQLEGALRALMPQG